MNKLSHSVLWIVTVLVTAFNIQPKQEPIEEVIDRGLKASTEQALLMAKSLKHRMVVCRKQSIKKESWKPAITVGGAVVSFRVNCGICTNTIRPRK